MDEPEGRLLRPLPSGIVAFVMTDIESSTQAWNRSASDMDQALTALDGAIREVVDAHDGRIVKARGEGDSHFAAFSEASRAVAAAAVMQQRGDDRLSLRACVLIGEARPRNDDYVGPIVNYGARIRSVAHGGQVVVTRPVVDITSGRLADDLSFHTLGMHRIRDVPTPIELFQLCGRGLRSSFPPLRSSAFTSSVMMAVVSVDEVRSTVRFREDDEHVLAWQRALIQSLRDLSDEYDGRYLKLLGDGCIVAFDDPRRALAFAATVQERGTFRIGVALGLVEEIEGELAGRTVYEAFTLMRAAEPGEVRCCAATQSVTRGPAG